jgi:tetratricopeptide (TPR) repeat protein
MNEAIELLTKQRDQALSRAQELANEFATVDLDGASELYIQAYELFERGEIDSVLIVLNEERLQDEYQKAAKEKAKGKRMVAEADTVISVTAGSYKLRADALIASGDHAGAYDQLLQLTRVYLRQGKGWDQEKLEALDGAVWLQHDSTGAHDLLVALDSARAGVEFRSPADPSWKSRLIGDQGVVHERAGNVRGARDAYRAMLVQAVAARGYHPTGHRACRPRSRSSCAP